MSLFLLLIDSVRTLDLNLHFKRHLFYKSVQMTTSVCNLDVVGAWCAASVVSCEL